MERKGPSPVPVATSHSSRCAGTYSNVKKPCGFGSTSTFEPSCRSNSAGVNAPSGTQASKTSSGSPGADASEYERDTNSPPGTYSPRFMNCPGRNAARSASRNVMRPGAQSRRLVTVVFDEGQGAY